MASCSEGQSRCLQVLATPHLLTRHGRSQMARPARQTARLQVLVAAPHCALRQAFSRSFRPFWHSANSLILSTGAGTLRQSISCVGGEPLFRQYTTLGICEHLNDPGATMMRFPPAIAGYGLEVQGPPLHERASSAIKLAVKFKVFFFDRIPPASLRIAGPAFDLCRICKEISELQYGFSGDRRFARCP